MNYNKLYNKIVEIAKHRNTKKGGDLIVESHHIVPKACGGSNYKSNLVNLTLKEHYVCHLLLERIYRKTESHKKMLRAVVMMGYRGNKNSRLYKKAREEHIKNLRNQKISIEQKNAISRANKNNKSRSGILHSQESKDKISIANKGKTHSEETKKQWSEKRKGRPAWNKGITGNTNPNYPKNRKPKSPMSPETIEKMRAARIKWHQNKGHVIHEKTTSIS